MNNKEPKKRNSKDRRKKKKLRPIAATIGKADLIKRLNDQGFSHYTLPSVSRPRTKNSHLKPLSCKLNPMNNPLAREKKQKQSSILFNNPVQSYLSPLKEEMLKSKHSAFMFTNQQFYKKKGEKEAVIPRDTISTMKFNQGQKNQVGGTGEISIQDEKMRNEIQKNYGFGGTHSEFSGFPKSKAATMKQNNKKRLMTPITIFDQKESSKGFASGFNTSKGFYAKPQFPDHVKNSLKTTGNFYNAQNPTSIHASNEMRHSKLIIDKLRGKYEDDKYNKIIEEEKDSGSKTADFMKSEFDIDEDKYEIPDREEVKKIIKTDPDDDIGNELDAYIDLILKNNSNVDEFVYLTPVEGANNPYKLKLSDFKKVDNKNRKKHGKREKESKEYYTISGKGLCHYKNDKPIEFIGLTNWLKERETFKQIQSLQFFQKFRKWITLRKWKENCQTFKRNHYRKSLSEKLFINNKNLKKSLYNHRALCYELSLQKFINLKAKDESGADVINLSSFSKAQQNMRDNVQAIIKNRSDICRENIKEGFKHCLDQLRTEKFSKNEKDNMGRPENQNFFRIKETAYERLGFGTNMNYDHRSQIRQLCLKFLRFAYLVDFIALEALSKIYMNSILDLRTQLEGLTDETEPKIFRDSEKGKNQYGGILPMFRIEVEFVEDRPNENPSIQNASIKFYEMPEPQETEPSAFKHFNILGHPFVIEFGDKSPAEIIDMRQVEEYNSKREFFMHEVTNIHKMWLSLNPSMSRFFQEIQKIFTDGMNSLLCFQRWSRHPDMENYSAILEDWDQQIGDPSDSEGNTFLNPDEWVAQTFKSSNQNDIKKLLQKAFNRANEYLWEFKDYLQIYWEYKNLDFNTLLNKDLANPRDVIKSLLMVNQYHKNYFETDIPFQADIGLLRIGSKDLKETLKPYPENIIDEFKEKLPAELRRRMRIFKDWINKKIKSLNEAADDEIKAFVDQKATLAKIDSEFPLIKQGIKFVDELYKVARDFTISADKTDYNLLTEVRNLEGSLNSEILSKNNEMTKNQKPIARQIRKEIKKLKEDIENLSKECSKAKYLDETSELDEMMEEKSKGENDEDMDEAAKTEKMIKDLEKFSETLAKYQEKADDYNRFELIVHENDDEEYEKTEFQNLKDLTRSLKSKLTLWTSLKEWKQKQENISDKTLEIIDFHHFLRESDKAGNQLKTCRLSIPPRNKKLKELEQMIKKFERTMRVVEAMMNKDLKQTNGSERKEIFKILKFGEQEEEISFEEMTFEKLIDLNASEYQNEIVRLSKQVTKEKELDEQYEKNVELTWKSFKIDLKNHKPGENNKDPVFILANEQDMVEKIDKLMTEVNNIYTNKYLKKSRNKVQKMREHIRLLSNCIDEWIKFQGQWKYLEKIFSTADFKKEIQESHIFDTTNNSYKQMAKKVKTNQEVTKLVKRGSAISLKVILQKMKGFNNDLNKLNKNINDFLDKRRGDIYRLHFVANNEVIKILANSSKNDDVQDFIGKLFENIDRLYFAGPDGFEEEGIPDFKGFFSREGERFDLLNISGNLSINDQFQSWMTALENSTMSTMRNLIKEKYDELINLEDEDDKKDYYRKNISQVLAVTHQMHWTANTKGYIDSQNDDEEEEPVYKWYVEIEKNLILLTDLVRSGLKGYRHKIIVGLITQEVHNRDVTYEMYLEGVSSTNEFGWQKQLRYDYGGDGSIKVKQVNATFDYGYEYFGPTSRIVITPLTERCWITITSALNLCLGSSPQGPAGTGKTESVKDLAKSLGKLCIVYNCSKQTSYKVMQRIFKGLILQGAWVCLDEFNRIYIEVLSVIAQQLDEIYKAKLVNDLEKMTFSGELLSLKRSPRNCGIFITMNPGYAGRTELPDNLKVLFRPVAMMIPNYQMICEILLLSEGFSQSQVLSGKIANLYKLSSEQLSQQKHYDYGLRAVKSVLVMAGDMRRENPYEDESIILIRAMKDANIPKFFKQDLILFEALINDLFPKIEMPAENFYDLENGVQNVLKRKGLEHENIDGLLVKVKELYKTINVRFGVMVVGEAMTGKSTCITSLKESMTELKEKMPDDERFKQIEAIFMNPKSVTMGELYGDVSALKDWNDGLASHYIRQATINVVEGNMRWIVFDGPVDASWIENMNSVLDDSRLLCLSNGERIRLGNNIRILFEVRDLEEASPATVSRCGMVYISEEDLGWEPTLLKWFRENIKEKRSLVNKEELIFSEHYCTFIWDQIMEIFEEIEKKLSKYGTRDPIESVYLQKVESFCNYMDIFLDSASGFKITENEDDMEYLFRYIVAMAAGWAFGAPLAEQEQDYVSNVCKEKCMDPSEDPIYNLLIDYELQRGINWSEKMEKIEFEHDISFYEIVVPTIEIVKTSFMMKALFKRQKNVFLTGKSGVGKSVLSHKLFKDKDAQMFSTLQFIFSAKTNTAQTQETILGTGNLEDKNKYTKSAKPGTKNVIIVDDVNMPEIEDYGAQSPIELLRQLIDFGYLYDKKDKYKISIEETCLLSIAAPPEGGRNPLTKRFTRHFNIICMNQPSENVLKSIFETILAHFYREYTKKVKEVVPNIVKSTIKIFQKIKKDKLPTPSKFHYTFNLRDVSKITMGMTQSSSGKVRTPETLVRLWIHECSRVFQDRLINDEDRDWFEEKITDLVKQNFMNIEQEYFERELIFKKEIIRFSGISAPNLPEFYEDIQNVDKLVSLLHTYEGDFNEDPKNGKKLKLVYFQEAIDHLLRIFRVLNMPRGNAMLIGIGGLGKQSLTRLSSSILSYELIELTNTGEFDLTKFKEKLRDDVLKECAGPEAGKTGNPVTFFMTDNQITNESILEIINNLLNTGEVPNLFAPDELEQFIQHMTDVVKKRNEDGIDNSTVMKRFIERVRENLHIVMCMSPVGDGLRSWCRKFPALVDCCTIDWYTDWPSEALYSVSLKLMEDDDNEENIDKTDIPKICKIFENFHQSATHASDRFTQITGRNIYITPKSLLDLVGLFKELYKRKQKAFTDNITTLEKGTVKLHETKEIVAKLEEELEEKKPILAEKKEIAAEKSKELEKSTQEVDIKQENAINETQMIQERRDKIEEDTREIREKVKEFEPQIIKTENVIKSITKDQINNFKVIVRNPKTLKKGIFKHLVMALCYILGDAYKFPTNDKDPQKLNKLIAKLVPGADKFKNQLLKRMKKIGEKASTMKASEAKKLREIVINKLLDEIKPGADTKKIAYPLALYCDGILKYYELMLSIEPHRKKERIAEEKLRVAEENLEKTKAELDLVIEQANILKADLKKVQDEEAKLEKDIEDANKKLERAKILNVLLKDEGIRWERSLKQYEFETKSILGNVILCAGAIGYFGPLTGQYRDKLYREWHQVVKDMKITIAPFNEFSLADIIGERLDIIDWQNSGLPTDNVSIENAIIAMNGFKWPMMIDPQLQAKNWLKKYLGAKKEPTQKIEGEIKEEEKNPEEVEEGMGYESDSESYDAYVEEEEVDELMVGEGLKVIREELDKDPDRLRRVLKNALENGLPVLVEDVGNVLMPILEPIISKQFSYDQIYKKWVMKFHSDDIDYNPEFRLFITTKIGNPDFLPNIFIKTNVINFIVTRRGLEDQLLGDIVRIEDPKLEKIKSENIENLSINRRKLIQQEKEILKRLGETKVSPVDDPELVEILKNSSNTSKDIKIKLEETKKSNEAIDIKRELYRIVATRGSILYFVIDDISKISPMYQYSLQYIKKLFVSAAIGTNQEELEDLDKRIKSLISNITKVIYTNVSRGLFEEHKFIFSLMICTAINIHDGSLRTDYWDLLLNGAPIYNKEGQPPNPDKEIYSPAAWDLAYYLEKNFEKFTGLCRDLETFINQFNYFAGAVEPYEEPLPDKTRLKAAKLTGFEKLILIKILRKEKLRVSLAGYVEEHMGEYYVDSLDVKMIDIYKESDCQTPIIFVLSRGADPKGQIKKLKERIEEEEERTIPYVSISLGQGQGIHGESAINNGIKNGDWVLLENCHLCKSWMPDLENIIKEIQASHEDEKPHKDFRLFLTSMPRDYFPVTILQNGIKLTTEPPRGIKANLVRSLHAVDEKKHLDNVDQSLRNAMHRLTVGLCFFHAIIQERRKFGPLGWNKLYQFNDSDLETSKKHLLHLLKDLTDSRDIPWDSLVYLTGQINYGGRVTDDNDKKLLLTVIKLFYNDGVLSNKFTFCESPVYIIPETDCLDSYIAYAESLPITDDPEVFGMHQNAEISYLSQEVEKITSIISNVKTNVIDESGIKIKSDDEKVLELIDTFVKKETGVPDLIDLEEISPNLLKKDPRGMNPSLTTVLLQEVDKYNILLDLAKSSLLKLRDAIMGTALMSEDLDEVYRSFLKLKVPNLWENVSYLSLKPLSAWLIDLRKRAKFIQDWVLKGNPIQFWLPGFFFPQGFITGVLQNHARENEIAIDKLIFEFQVSELPLEMIEEAPELGGTYVSGLFLDGAKWDPRKKSLGDQDDGILYPEMPMIIFKPIIDPKFEDLSKREIERRKNMKKIPKYKCPLYKTTQRYGTLSTIGQSTNFILHINLPAINFPPHIWVLRGTALVCELKE